MYGRNHVKNLFCEEFCLWEELVWYQFFIQYTLLFKRIFSWSFSKHSDQTSSSIYSLVFILFCFSINYKKIRNNKLDMYILASWDILMKSICFLRASSWAWRLAFTSSSLFWSANLARSSFVKNLGWAKKIIRSFQTKVFYWINKFFSTKFVNSKLRFFVIFEKQSWAKFHKAV